MNNFKDEHQLFITGLQNSHGTSGDNSQSVIDSLQNQINFLQKTNSQLTAQSTQLLKKLNQLEVNESTHIQELTLERSQCDSLNLQLDATTNNLNLLEENLKSLKAKYNNEINLNLNLKNKLNNESILLQNDNLDMHYSQLKALNDLKDDYVGELNSKFDLCVNNLDKYTNNKNTDIGNGTGTGKQQDLNETEDDTQNVSNLLHEFQIKNNNLTNLIIYSIKDKQDIDKLNYLYKLAQQKILNWTTQENFDSIKSVQFANFTNTATPVAKTNHNSNNNILGTSSPTANAFRLSSPSGMPYSMKKNSSNTNNSGGHISNNSDSTGSRSAHKTNSSGRPRPSSMLLNNAANVGELPGIKRRVSKRQPSLTNN